MALTRIFKTPDDATRAAHLYLERCRANLQPRETGQEWNLHLTGVASYCILPTFNTETGEKIKTDYVPAVRCKKHDSYRISLFNLIGQSPQFSSPFCRICFIECSFCGQIRDASRAVRTDGHSACETCAALHSHCREHNHWWRNTDERGCSLCFAEKESWKKLKVDEKIAEEILNKARRSATRKKNKGEKENLYRIMCRRTRDYRILEIIEKVGVLPVQLCLIGGGDDYMDSADIMVSNDLRLPNHPLTRVVTVSPTMAQTMPYTIALGRTFRRSNANVAQLVTWLKAFK